MTTIPETIVENTWREVASFASRDAWRAMEKVTKRQPALLAYVMASTRECGEDAQELAVYLFFVVLRMFDQLPGHRLKRVSITQVERRAAENEAMLERLGGAHERFLERAAHVQAESQPHVLRYLTEAILKGEDPEVELTEEESGLLFLVLKTVVDLLDGACKRGRRR
jgi:hypothetical protein